MHGLDFSQEMLEAARTKNVYVALDDPVNDKGTRERDYRNP